MAYSPHTARTVQPAHTFFAALRPAVSSSNGWNGPGPMPMHAARPIHDVSPSGSRRFLLAMRRRTSPLLDPRGDVRPMPRRTATHRPPRTRENPLQPPVLYRPKGVPRPSGDLSDPHRIGDVNGGRGLLAGGGHQDSTNPSMAASWSRPPWNEPGSSPQSTTSPFS